MFFCLCPLLCTTCYTRSHHRRPNKTIQQFTNQEAYRNVFQISSRQTQPVAPADIAPPNGRPQAAGSQPGSFDPVDPVDALFDEIVGEERRIGMMIDLCSFDHPMVRPLVNGKSYDGSDAYDAAMHRRLARLLNDGQSGGKLHWESERFDAYTNRAPCGAKKVCCMEITITITADTTCDYRCEEKEHECLLKHREELTVVWIFDFVTRETPLAQASVHRSRRERGRVVLNKDFTLDDGLAMTRAKEEAQKIDWTWHGQDTLDLNALWLYAYRSVMSIATEMDR